MMNTKLFKSTFHFLVLSYEVLSKADIGILSMFVLFPHKLVQYTFCSRFSFIFIIVNLWVKFDQCYFNTVFFKGYQLLFDQMENDQSPSSF